MSLPILYSYRRCPYAMRARMALKLAEIQVEIREVSLKNKPKHMLQVSPKGTVPVLVLPEGKVIDESLDIILFALQKHALGGSLDAAAGALIGKNDGSFKYALDAYKYPEKVQGRTQTQHRTEAEVFLQELETLLNHNIYLFNAAPGLADIAIFPFVRQFAAVDAAWWETSPYQKLRVWLKKLAESSLFISVMEKQPTYVE